MVESLDGNDNNLAVGKSCKKAGFRLQPPVCVAMLSILKKDWIWRASAKRERKKRGENKIGHFAPYFEKDYGRQTPLLCSEDWMR